MHGDIGMITIAITIIITPTAHMDDRPLPNNKTELNTNNLCNLWGHVMLKKFKPGSCLAGSKPSVNQTPYQKYLVHHSNVASWRLISLAIQLF